MRFLEYLTENVAKEQHLLHLEHPEDLPISHGHAGFHHAVEALKAVHEKLQGGFNNTKITTKYDGSPSVIFGHDPQNGKFFVSTKSAFNKEPKINYTPRDIERNHGHAPGLVSKLKTALEHLPKVAPKTGVYQGDMMYSKPDVHEHKGMYHFTPNTIMYSAKKSSPEGKKIENAHMGIVVHSKYHGSSLGHMQVHFDPDLHNFKEHKDVHRIDPETDVARHESENDLAFQHHIKRAEKEYQTAHPDTLHTISHHAVHVKTYINHTVRQDETPTTEGYSKHLMDIGKRNISSVKTAKAKQQKVEHMMTNLRYVQEHKDHFDSAFKIHHHIQKAKDVLVKSLDQNQKFEHSIGGKEVGPEGHVVIHSGAPLKLVNRAEFSKANFEKNRD